MEKSDPCKKHLHYTPIASNEFVIKFGEGSAAVTKNPKRWNYNEDAGSEDLVIR